MSWIPTLTLFVMMCAMGMTLAPRDFARVFAQPRAFVLGAAGQLLLLPAVAIAIAAALGLSHELAVGLMLIAACPGGITSNTLAWLARGDTALSISLTALSSLLAFATVPLVLGFGLRVLGESAGAVSVPLLETAVTLAGTTALPVVLGMAFGSRYPDAAVRWAPRLLMGSTSVLLAMVGALGLQLGSGDDDIAGLFGRAALSVLLLVSIMTALGLGASRLLALSAAQASGSCTCP